MNFQTPDYRVLRSDRRTVSLQLTPDGQLLVRCPRKMPEAAIRAFVQSKRGWVNRQLQKLPRTALPVFSQEQLQELKTRARALIVRRVEYFAPRIGVSYGTVTVRSQRTRWGSCSGMGNLSFNCLLLLAPPQVLDYVVIHELCHRRHLNHSAAFWAEVEKHMPDYRQARGWLKEHAMQLLARLP